MQQPFPAEMEKKKVPSMPKSHTDPISLRVAGVALFVALLSMTITVWEGLEFRAHNRLSVKPFLMLDRNIANTTNQAGQIIERECTLRLSNRGLGPAVIQSVVIEVAGRSFATWEEAFIAAGSDQKITSRFTFDPGDVIDADYENDLVTLVYERGKTDQLILRIDYSSIYEEDFRVRQRCFD